MPAFILISEGLGRSVGSLMFDFDVPIELMQNVKPSERDQYVPKGTYIIVNLYQGHISYDIKDPQSEGVWHVENYAHFTSICTLLGYPLPKPKRASVRETLMKNFKG